jgi:hypothetical protein
VAKHGCDVAKHGCDVAKHGCDVAKYGCDVAKHGCDVAKHWCDVAKLLARRTAVQQSQVRFPTWQQHGGLSLLSGTCDEETQRDFNECKWMFVKKYDCMLKIEKSIKLFF